MSSAFPYPGNDLEALFRGGGYNSVNPTPMLRQMPPKKAADGKVIEKKNDNGYLRFKQYLHCGQCRYQ